MGIRIMIIFFAWNTNTHVIFKRNAKRKERKRFHKKMIIDVILIRMINLHYIGGVQKEIDMQNAQTKKNKRNPLKKNRKVV